ncbi:MAG TPA: hypothetical protein VLA19_04755, partial [Herpetosiphonaceae bacterium]|nr:hypothetical protein [Herpetosiphonaceae bacterium]
GAATVLREVIHGPLSPAEQAKLERRLEPARKVLGEAVAVVAWAEGRDMSLEQAIRYALQYLEEPRVLG